MTKDEDILKPVSEAKFSAAYDEYILGRSYVENVAYYRSTKRRYWRTYQHLLRLPLQKSYSVLEIGGGQFAVLMNKLHGLDCSAGDATEAPRDDLAEAGISFELVDLFTGATPKKEFDLVILLEVIEHIPRPPYLIIDELSASIKQDGHLFMTTPNGNRLRNILYAAAGKEILDKYRVPEPGETLGHMHEYTLPQMIWQVERSAMTAAFLEQHDCAWEGMTPGAKAMRTLTQPFNVFPHLRESLVLALSKPSGV